MAPIGGLSQKFSQKLIENTGVLVYFLMFLKELHIYVIGIGVNRNRCHYVASLIMMWVLGFKYPFNFSYSI